MRSFAAAGALLLTLLLLAAGCMWQVPTADRSVEDRYRNMEPPEGKALIYVTREVRPPISATRTRLYLNGHSWATVKGGTFAVAAVSPGHHQVTVALDQKARLVFDALAGQKLYVLHTVSMGPKGFAVHLKRLRRDQGRRLLRRSRLSLKNDLLPDMR